MLRKGQEEFITITIAPGQIALGAMRHVPRFIAEVWRTSPKLTALGIFLRLIRALIPAAMLFVGKQIIDTILPLIGQGAAVDLTDWIFSPAAQPLLLWIAAEFALALAADLIGRVTGMVDVLLTERYVNAMSVRLMEHAASLDLAHFESADQQDRLDRARRQASGRGNLLGQVLGFAQSIITILTFAVGLALYTPWLVLLVALALIPGFVSEAHFNTLAYRLNFRKTPERRTLDYLRYLGASVETAKEVKLYGLGGYFITRFSKLAADLYRASRLLAQRRAAWGGFFAIIATSAYYSAYLLVIWHTVTGTLTLGDLTFLGGSLLRLRTLLETLLLGLSELAAQSLYLDDLFSFFAIRPDIVRPVNAVPVPEPIRQGFSLRNVGFRYPGTNDWVIRGLDLDIGAGEVIALVGENGAGKSTLVKLLCRLYDPDEGEILLDGVDLRCYDPVALQQHIGVIFQDFVRYDVSARDNIAMGRIDDRERLDLIQSAAQRSLADTIIAKLPRGYDQPVGKRFTDGYDLSGGEWQRIAIARAYMRDAQILVLDEPSAALDARAEHEVFQRFKELAEGRMVVLISHRFSTVRMADRIVVLEHGRILEMGTHAALLAKGGRYADLFELQANGYR
ncbi:ABC transporter ATP-binding protein [Lacibacterium aquatile]|uniref:ABC transporter ATP-binding protein n=1 Tax=Lacibacterium aquatile TaxID=1168082 RepID=A0ABW5DQM5_9PROT